MKEHEKWKENETSLISVLQMVLSRYPVPKSEIWARWTLPFCRFSASISHKYDVTEQSGKAMRKWKCNISTVFCSICLKFCRLLEVSKILISNLVAMGTKIKQLSVIEQTKGVLFKQKCNSKNNFKQYSLIIAAGNIIFWKKIGDTLFLLWENNSLF